jgi:hypothetical protein
MILLKSGLYKSREYRGAPLSAHEMGLLSTQIGPRNVVQLVLYLLRHSLFMDVRSIAEEVGVSSETVHRQLTESLELQPRFIRPRPLL